MADFQITPPPELVQQWAAQREYLSDQAVFSGIAQWGADQELEACCEWLGGSGYAGTGTTLRAARRPKPQTLNSIALQMLGTIERDGHYIPEITDTIRRALEALPND
jgi:hypothetical protein